METALDKLNEDERKEFWASIALRYSANIGVRSQAKLLKHFGSAYKAVQNLDKWGEVGLLAKAEFVANDKWREHGRREWENARDLDAHIVLWTSDLYPALLKEIPDAPLYFYVSGNIELLLNPCLAVVGSRISSPLGQNVSAYLGKALALSGVTVISGMARGIDRSAHFGALQEIGSSIGVLGSGIDVIYPKNNDDIYFSLKENGLLISEFAPGTQPDPTHFPIRNRIISGMSHGVIVVEADIKSGSMITARLANEQGRNVYTVPGAIGSRYSHGCQELLRQGAKAVFNAEDILEDLLPILQADAHQISAILKAKKIDANAVFNQISTLDIKAQEEEILNMKNRDKIQKPSAKEIAKNEIEIYNKIKKVSLEKNKFPENSMEWNIVEILKKDKLQIDNIFEELQARSLDINMQMLTVMLVNLEMEEYIKRHEGGWFTLYE